MMSTPTAAAAEMVPEYEAAKSAGLAVASHALLFCRTFPPVLPYFPMQHNMSCPLPALTRFSLVVPFAAMTLLYLRRLQLA